jgi:hypothetical protein
MSRGHGDRMTRQQELAVAALLELPTITAAAAAVGLDESTLRQWLKDPGFAAAYADARREVLERAVTRLVRTLGKAVDALERNLTAERPADQLRAAALVLEHATKGVEVLDLARQLDELRRRIEEGQRDDGDLEGRGGEAPEGPGPGGGGGESPHPVDPLPGPPNLGVQQPG